MATIKRKDNGYIQDNVEPLYIGGTDKIAFWRDENANYSPDLWEEVPENKPDFSYPIKVLGAMLEGNLTNKNAAILKEKVASNIQQLEAAIEILKNHSKQ